MTPEVGSAVCALCGASHFDPEFAATRITLVCCECDARAVNVDGAEPEWESWTDSGENPVFIGGVKCWRRYRYGGYVTMRDHWDCRDIGEFYSRIGFM